jgi:mono/diheme cytochrome c family protein
MRGPKHFSYIVGTVAVVASAGCVDDSSAAQASGQQSRRQRQQAARSRQPSRPPARQPATRTPQRDTARPPAPAVPAAAAAMPATSPRPLPDSLRFVDHPHHIQLGRTAPNPSALRLANPLEADPQVRTVGSQLYHSYNCIDCHGMDGSGAMGPSLADGRWRFGGTSAEVFESIYQGRPDGMPAWGGRISDADIWRLVAYVRSLEVGKNVTTENFTSKAQQRMGH